MELKTQQRWFLNVDGSFIEQTGKRGVGVIFGNHVGEVILIAWRVLFRCASANAAEARTSRRGIR
jgi:hypothetical protein